MGGSDDSGSGDKSLDIFGVKPVGQAALKVTEATVDGAGEFLSRICLPAAEEFGLLLQDRVRVWRSDQMLKLTVRSQKKYQEAFGNAKRHAHPRLVSAILEHGSWEDDAQIQDLWAGLLAASCTADGKSQETLIFINLLKDMTSPEAKLIAFLAGKCAKRKTKTGLILSESTFFSTPDLFEVTGVNDIHVLDIMIDHLHQLGMLDVGSSLATDGLELHSLSIAALALHFYSRCMAPGKSVFEFYDVKDPPNGG
ncbi:hypothetical protein [Caulobacter sp.]|uniref:Abi-alpha family protein n=1 Tax=Caulobacter sp. TaxID=78 RepID=UPI001B1829CF|nr:hypothetical protein [Caulobacter sp.]MBO9543729.1 hypothetical protein [Caulobacter sp.]